MTSITASGSLRRRRASSHAGRTSNAVKTTATAHRRLNAHLENPTRRAPRVFLSLLGRIHRLLPSIVRRRVPVTFIGYALINGSGFLIDIAFLWLFYERLHWFYPLAVTVGYAIAGVYSLLLNRWLNFQSHGSLTAQGSRYAVGLVSQYVIFILGLSSLLHMLGMNAELARFVSACCEGVYLYALMRLWVFRGTPEPATEHA
ncbi:GtrA family protein [Actinomyces sp.]|uniref:GtrA family protein n=1 Tax=Actinomyces sp. TaxID=29317 RepID=UPI0026DD5707|nr:GtrA family protein [Actinomyces sp.]MDO4901675.1 GtrA family protein [Actinomyces sp.]